MEKLESLKEMLIRMFEQELMHPEKANTCQLGQVMDMIKDIEEAMYYHHMRQPK